MRVYKKETNEQLATQQSRMAAFTSIVGRDSPHRLCVSQLY